MMITKPNKIYEDQTNKNFNYEKPVGWNVKPKSFKMKWWEILKAGLFDEEMDAKFQRRYDRWKENLKVLLITFLTVFILMFIILNSSFLSTPMKSKSYTNDSWVDQGLEIGRAHV